MSKMAFVEYKCPCCNKIIYPNSQWAYKIKNGNEKAKYYCSWTCYNKGKSELNKKKVRIRKTFRWRNGEK